MAARGAFLSIETLDMMDFPFVNGDRVFVKSGQWEGKSGIFQRLEGTTGAARIEMETEEEATQPLIRIIQLRDLHPIPPTPGPSTLTMSHDCYEWLLSDVCELHERVREMMERVMRLQVLNIHEEQNPGQPHPP
jgi:hypothetical protein